ncbi:MAG: flagellar export chaperone FliS [Actinobacteria bacterium]|nr:flagellar export chaperone FliS [Thermoleophilia bacterium]MCB9010671.1 flagellar export chaperone FliS [Actinomycetota bacterium]
MTHQSRALSDQSQYTARAVQTASPGQLVVMLYDGMIRFLGKAKAGFASGAPGDAGLALGRAQAICTELRVSLDMTQGEIAANLAGIYDWISEEMTAARLDQDVQRIDRMLPMIADLREAWAQIANTPKPQTGAGRPVVGVNLAG